MSEPTSYYVKRKKQLLWEFDFVAKSARSVLGRYFGENVSPLLVETRREFENLIPQLPYMGGKQPFTEFIVFSGMLLAIYRISKAHGKTVEQVGEMILEIGREFLKSFPPFLLRLFMPVNFSKHYVEGLRKRAAETHTREYPEGYMINFVEGDGKTFDYGVDYLECASCKFFAKHGAPELAPYLCPVDILYSEALGWGLTRTQTLAEGAELCDFRFKQDGKTNVAVPASLKAFIARGE